MAGRAWRRPDAEDDAQPAAHDRRKADAGDGPGDASEAQQQQGLGQELDADVAGLGAHSAPQADLIAAFEDGIDTSVAWGRLLA